MMPSCHSRKGQSRLVSLGHWPIRHGICSATTLELRRTLYPCLKDSKRSSRKLRSILSLEQSSFVRMELQFRLLSLQLQMGSRASLKNLRQDSCSEESRPYLLHARRVRLI